MQQLENSYSDSANITCQGNIKGLSVWNASVTYRCSVAAMWSELCRSLFA